MAVVEIPGDEIERLSNALGTVLDLIDGKAPPFMTEREVGAPLADAAQFFDEEWDDGRTQLRRECEALKDACDQIVKTFTETDDGLGKSLTPDGAENNGTTPDADAPDKTNVGKR